MKHLDTEQMTVLTGLTASGWADPAELERAEADLTDPGQLLQMTEAELHLVPAALAAIRSARRQLGEQRFA